MTKFYKIRHIPSGLFYKPSVHGSKINVSKLGKTYQRKPNLKKYIGHNVCWGWHEYEKTILSDWEIVEYNNNEQPKIELIHFDDWEVLIKDGIILLENHTLDPSQILEALQIKFEQTYISDDELSSSGKDVETYLEKYERK